jgi:ABC-type transport system involved in multi-copper enzyme maturation permease subunit
VREGLEQRLRRMGVALQSPILVRELRALLRGRKFFVSHMLLLTILAGVLLIAATTAAATEDSDPADLGLLLFKAFLFGLSVVVIFLVPAFSCTAITTERESKTLDLLLTTTIKPWEVVWGKLLSALVVILLFMASALPLVTVCFLFGGISPWDLALLYSLVLFGTLVVSSVSLTVSAHCRESKASVVVSYVLTLIIMVAMIIALVSAVWTLARGRGGVGVFAAALSRYDWREQLLIFAVPAFVGISIFAANFAAASNRLKPATANRSTNLRVIWTVFLLVGLLLYALICWVETILAKTANSWDELSIASLSVAAPILWVGAMYFAAEEAILPPRVREDTARLRGGLVPLRAFMPGPLTGVAFAVFFVLLALGGLASFNASFAIDANQGDWAWINLAAAVPVALFIFTAAALAALFSSFGFTHRGAGLAAFGASSLLAFGPLILLACQEAVSGVSASRPWSLHYLSPIVAMLSAWDECPRLWRDLVVVGGVKLPMWIATALAYGLAAPLIWVWAGGRVRRLRARWSRELELQAAAARPLREEPVAADAPPAAGAAPAAPGETPAGGE